MRKLLMIGTAAVCLAAAGCSDVGSAWDEHVVSNWNENVKPLYSKSEDLGPLEARETDVGRVLTTKSGMTVYTYRDDPNGRSVCTGGCTRNWRPVEAKADVKPSGKVSVIKRKDGKRQLAYDGRPLYTWSKDARPGDTGGHNVSGAWHVARP
jgi:predicted lipoprotein with Yx(FWY)xxD motif